MNVGSPSPFDASPVSGGEGPMALKAATVSEAKFQGMFENSPCATSLTRARDGLI